MSAASCGISCLARCQPETSSARSVPTICPSPGMALATEPAWIDPHISETPLRGSTRRDNTSWVVVASAPSAPTMSWVRCGREVCPPRPLRVMVTWSTAEVIGPTLRASLADVGPRIAVQRVDLGQILQHSPVDRVQRAAGTGLLGRLEDQPDAAGQQVQVAEPGQHQSRADQDRGVHVVPAGVADARISRAIADVLAVGDGQRIDVGAQSDHAGGEVEAVRQHVAVRAGADRQHLGDQAGPLEFVDDDAGGPILGVTDLGIGVQIAADADQPVVEPLDLAGDRSATGLVEGGIRHLRQCVTTDPPGRDGLGVVTRQSRTRDKLG